MSILHQLIDDFTEGRLNYVRITLEREEVNHMTEEGKVEGAPDEFSAKQQQADTPPVETQVGTGNNPLPEHGGTGDVDEVRDPAGDSGQPQTQAEHDERSAEAEDEG